MFYTRNLSNKEVEKVPWGKVARSACGVSKSLLNFGKKTIFLDFPILPQGKDMHAS